jgi:UDP-2,3-diacylglucosamine hydrolase
MTAAPTVSQEGPLALICGGGSLPLAVADFVAKRGRKVLLFPLRGFANPADFSGRAPEWVGLGQFGKFYGAAQVSGCRDVVLIGSMVRPSLRQIWPDLRTVMAMPRIIAAFRGGDDHLLSGVGRLLEEYGFRLVGAHEVAPEILVPEGTLGRFAPPEREDIAVGLDYLRATGRFDVGQAVVVAKRHVLAVEAIEGTDEMLARVMQLRANGRIRAPAGAGVLVKAPKPGQDRRFDLPSIGPQTVEGAGRAGLAGIAVIAGSTIMAQPEQLVQAADRAKIFVVGVPAEPSR